MDAAQATSVIGSPANRAKGLEVQKQSIVLLQNRKPPAAAALLPLRAGATVFTMGMGQADVARYGFTVIDGNAVRASRARAPPGPMPPSSASRSVTRTPTNTDRGTPRPAPIRRSAIR